MMRVQMVIVCLVAICAVGQSDTHNKDLPYTYELYSWRGTGDTWNFSLLYTTDRTKSGEEVFSEKTALHGVASLKKRINRLPRGSTIVWIDHNLWGTNTQTTLHLQSPPPAVKEQVNHYATAHGIKVVK